MSREDTGGDDLAVTYRATAVWCSERIDQRWRAIPEDSGCKGLKTHQSAILRAFPSISRNLLNLSIIGRLIDTMHL